MGNTDIRRIFERLDGIGERLSRLEGICKARGVCPVAAKQVVIKNSGSAKNDKNWLQWLVGALISIIGALVGAQFK